MHDAEYHALIRAARGWNGAQPQGALRQATADLLARVPQDPSLLSRIGASLAGLDPGAAAWLAVTCGTAVERGANAQLTGRAVMGLLASWLPELPGQTTGQASRLELFQFVCQAAVSHLARMSAMREEMGRDASLIERLDQLGVHSHGAIWVREALLKHSAALLLLHPTSGRGLRTRYENVSNCFHLFSLLQSAIGTRLEGGRVPDETVARVARGKSDAPVTDHAWWDYGDPQSRQSDPRQSIRGEGLTREIPVIDDVQVMVAWTLRLERTWDAAFLQPHLEAMPADARVEAALPADEAAAWMKRLGIATAKRRWPWSRR
jgi:hypothetical protein